MRYRRPLSIKIANLCRVQKISTVMLRTDRALTNPVIVIFMACRESCWEGDLIKSSPPEGQEGNPSSSITAQSGHPRRSEDRRPMPPNTKRNNRGKNSWLNKWQGCAVHREYTA